jgi:peptide/nickel transport system permease protein
MIVRRLLVTIPMLFGAAVIVFFVLRLIPGDPATAILGSHSSPALVAQVRADLGLNKPIYVQFGDWISRILLHGNFGQDYITSQSISSEMASRLPVTLELCALAFAGSVIIAIPAGVVAAAHRGGWADRIIQFVSVVTIAIPDFVFGILGILLFALVLKLVPSSGYIPLRVSPWENIQSLALPAIALALGFAGVLARVTRSAMIEALQADNIVFARAVGIQPRSIVYRHALRSAAIPIVTVAGMQAGYILGSTVVIETLFVVPGIGQEVVQAMLNRDYTVMQACVLIFVTGFILMNLLTDLFYLVLNPKLRRAAT